MEWKWGEARPNWKADLTMNQSRVSTLETCVLINNAFYKSSIFWPLYYIFNNSLFQFGSVQEYAISLHISYVRIHTLISALIEWTNEHYVEVEMSASFSFALNISTSGTRNSCQYCRNTSLFPLKAVNKYRN